MSSRCTVTKALELLGPELSPRAAAAALTRAINDEACHAYCKGEQIVAHAGILREHANRSHPVPDPP